MKQTEYRQQLFKARNEYDDENYLGLISTLINFNSSLNYHHLSSSIVRKQEIENL